MATNPGIPFDPALLNVVVNRSACERRAAELTTRRSVKKDFQLAWLIRCLECVDLTTLGGDDTDGNVRRLCAKAKKPIGYEVLKGLGIEDRNIKVGAVCVYPNRVKEAVKQLKGSNIPVASVATGFPAGQTPLSTRLQEIVLAVEDGAREIDIVVSRTQVITGQWAQLYAEVGEMRLACDRLYKKTKLDEDRVHLKTILATGECPTYTDVYRASMVCMMGGADFIKTSTGKEAVNATLSVSLVMVRAIRKYYELTGLKIGFKPAGGIRAAKDSLAYMILMREELGEEWQHPHLFRIGASSLVEDIERQLYHGAFGRYHASNYIAMA